MSNAGRLGVEYLIWQGRIWSVARSSEGWRSYDGGGMHDPTSVTGEPSDHLHFTAVSEVANHPAISRAGPGRAPAWREQYNSPASTGRTRLRCRRRSRDLRKIVGALLLTYGLVIAVLMVVACAATWTIASAQGSWQTASNAKTGLYVALGGAVLTGGSLVWVNWLLSIGASL